MVELDKRIADMEETIKGYQLDYKNASPEDKRLLLRAISSKAEILRRLMDEKNKSPPQGSKVPLQSGFGASPHPLVFLDHDIWLAQLAFGVLGLGFLVAGGSINVVKHHQRASNKFFRSLLSTANFELSKINYSAMPRDQMYVGISKTPHERLNLHSNNKVVALVGDNRSGKTIFLSRSILTDVFPWWNRFFFPPRGLFLTGSQKYATVDAWLKNQIPTTERDDPWSAMMDQLVQRRDEQWARIVLHKTFKEMLPVYLRPRPAIIVVDQAEELIRAYRATFLTSFYQLIKRGRDNDLFRLVLVVNTESAVKALKLLNGGNMFAVVQAPKVSREAVANAYGEGFAEVFDDCDSCIGMAFDYTTDTERPKDMTAREYAAAKKERYIKDNCLAVEITRDEFTKAGEHIKN